MRALYTLAGLACPFLLAAQVNLTLLGNLDYQALHQSDLSDVWGYEDQTGNEYALVGVNDGGISVVDISDPANPNEVFFMPGPSTIWRDLKVWNDHAYVTNEAGGGLAIIDLSTLPGNTNLTTTNYNTGGWTAAHNLYIDENGICYIFGANGAGNGGAKFLDLNVDPMAPVFLGQWDPIYSHDGMVRGDTMYTANINQGYFSVVDVSDKTNPQVLATQTTGNNYAHNIWVSDDGDHVFTTDEVNDGYLGAYDISDLSDIQEVDLTLSDPGSGTIIHNTHFMNDYVITSYYSYGVTIHDVSRPTNVIEVGHYDTSPASGGGFTGCWGVYPYLPSAKILATDIETGLYVLEPNYQRACWLEGNITDLSNSMPVFNANIELQSTNATDQSALDGSYATGYHAAGTYTVRVSAAGFAEELATGVTLMAGQVTNLDVQLTPLLPFAFSGQVTEIGSGSAIENAQVVFRSEFYNYDMTTDAAGNYAIPQFFESNYEVSVGHWGHITTCASTNYDANSSPVDFQLGTGYYDDFSVDLGWLVTGNAGSGEWERGEPDGQSFQTIHIVPFDDILSDCGKEAYVTGIGGNLAENAVAGRTILTSPSFDATTFSDPYVNFQFWFTNVGLNGTLSDSLLIQLTDGTNTVLVEAITPATNQQQAWFQRSIKVSDHLMPTSGMQLILTAKKPATTQPELLEVVVDVFSVTGQLVSVEELVAAGYLTLFPNPSNGDLFLNVHTSIGQPLDLRIIDLNGREVLREQDALRSGRNDLQFDLPAGVYVLHAFNEKMSLQPVRLVIR